MKNIKTKKFKRSIKTLLLTNGLVLIAVAMIAPIYAIFVKDIWGDLMDASMAWWIFALSAWITSLISWKVTDRLKRKILVVVFWYYIMGIWFFLYLLVDSILFLFAVQVFIWLWEAIYSPSFDALYWNNINKKQKGLEWGAWESMNYFTIAIWAFSWWILVTYLGFNSIFILMWTLCMVSWTYLYILSSKESCKIKQK